jgi:hypothetical protein
MSQLLIYAHKRQRIACESFLELFRKLDTVVNISSTSMKQGYCGRWPKELLSQRGKDLAGSDDNKDSTASSSGREWCWRVQIKTCNRLSLRNQELWRALRMLNLTWFACQTRTFGFPGIHCKINSATISTLQYIYTSSSITSQKKHRRTDALLRSPDNLDEPADWIIKTVFSISRHM